MTNNKNEAEYAESRQGETSWSSDHPLSTEQDVLYALIQGVEGHNVGEGGHLGLRERKILVGRW